MRYEEYGSYATSVYERDGKWWVGRVRKPDGGLEEMAMGKGLIDRPGISDKSFDSLEKAESAAHKQLEDAVGRTFDAEWKEKC